MGRTVGELLDTCGYLELLDWRDYYILEPWGEWRADVRSAHVVATLANINRDTKKRSKPYSIDEFILFKRPEEKLEKEQKERERSEKGVGAKMDPALLQWLMYKSR